MMRRYFLVIVAALISALSVDVSADMNVAKLLNPASLNERAPDLYRVNFDTSKGLIVIEVHRDWAPLGADRFYNLVKNGFYDGARFFSMDPGVRAGFGNCANAKVQQAWVSQKLPEEPLKMGAKRGRLIWAAAPNARTTKLNINLKDNSARFDPHRFTAIGDVVIGMDVADKLYSGYGEHYPRGTGPRQDRMVAEGNAYVEKDFPLLDYIKTGTIAK